MKGASAAAALTAGLLVMLTVPAQFGGSSAATLRVTVSMAPRGK
jgi:hypothetical protein